MTINLAYFYLLSPLHTGGTSQEGNVVGIAREIHTDFPYLPSSTIRGRLRAATPESQRSQLWGNTLEDITQPQAANSPEGESKTETRETNLTQGELWVGDGSLLWFPISSLSHGVVWVTSPFLLRRWLRTYATPSYSLPALNSFSFGNHQDLYLRDAIFPAKTLHPFEEWQQYIPQGSPETETISQVLVLDNRDCSVLIQSSLWRQVKVKLDSNKTVEGGFRYEEAIPPETVMYFPFGRTVAANGKPETSLQTLQTLLSQNQQEQTPWQFGGQESLGRGLVELWTAPTPLAQNQSS
ncbi:MAG: type III-B CRISPR module RAMP protein Cmr4 [Kamptonema sp. SIO4C4]|nr:type III-B CRISPR module RAMP protein Cmr4 [Kamptonema sp. SIO4C4]